MKQYSEFLIGLSRDQTLTSAYLDQEKVALDLPAKLR